MPRLPKEVEAFMNTPRKRTWRSRFFWFGFWLLVVFGMAGFFGYTYYRDLAKKEDIAKVGELPQRSIVFDRKGAEIGRLHGANRIVVPLEGVSPFFVDALLAREDSRFYRHAGIDYRGVARATVRNVKEWDFVQGASTLTMQLARVSYDIREKSLHRKLLEAMLARRIEAAYDKEQILELYINRVYFGTGVYGIERAAKAHFGKPAAELTLSESAMLAGIIRAPNRFSPFRHLEDAKRERDTVLGRMLELGFITDDELAAAKAEEPEIRSAEESRVFQNSYALDMVRRDLDLILEKAETEDGGLLIYTTFDLELQKAAETAVETKLAEIEERPNFGHPTRSEFLADESENKRTAYLQGAAVAIDNATGGIRAIVGGRDFRESQFNRATQSKRQIGSLFKPFVYAAAYQRGLLPGSYVNDNAIARGEIPWTPGHWSPNNSDGEFHGLQAAEYGLIKSRNTMTVRVGERAGIDHVLQVAKLAGFDAPQEKSAQIYIGNLGGDLRAVTSAYSAFAQDGVRMRPYVIQAIQNRRGDMLYSNTPVAQRVTSPAASYLTNQTLQKVITEGTGVRARTLGVKGAAAGKTGTTNDYHDAWFVGFNDKLTCGVWVGLDQPQTIMDRGYGSTLALPIWAEILNFAQENGYPSSSFMSQVEVVNVNVCRSTGHVASRACERQGHLYQTALPYELAPQHYCPEHGWRLGQPQPSDPDRPGFFGRIREWFR